MGQFSRNVMVIAFSNGHIAFHLVQCVLAIHHRIWSFGDAAADRMGPDMNARCARNKRKRVVTDPRSIDAITYRQRSELLYHHYFEVDGDVAPDNANHVAVNMEWPGFNPSPKYYERCGGKKITGPFG